MNALTISGWIMTTLGFVLAAVQTYRVKKLTRRNREQLQLFIEDANYVSFEHEIIDKIAPKLDDPMILRFLVSSHQRACDLYRNLVDFYLASERRFTYEDVQRVCQTRMVNYQWQAECWRDRTIMRPENRKKEMPAAICVADDRSRRFQAIEARDAKLHANASKRPASGETASS